MVASISRSLFSPLSKWLLALALVGLGCQPNDLIKVSFHLQQLCYGGICTSSFVYLRAYFLTSNDSIMN